MYRFFKVAIGIKQRLLILLFTCNFQVGASNKIVFTHSDGQWTAQEEKQFAAEAESKRQSFQQQQEQENRALIQDNLRENEQNTEKSSFLGRLISCFSCTKKQVDEDDGTLQKGIDVLYQLQGKDTDGDGHGLPIDLAQIVFDYAREINPVEFFKCGNRILGENIIDCLTHQQENGTFNCVVATSRGLRWFAKKSSPISQVHEHIDPAFLLDLQEIGILHARDAWYTVTLRDERRKYSPDPRLLIWNTSTVTIDFSHHADCFSLPILNGKPLVVLGGGNAIRILDGDTGALLNRLLLPEGTQGNVIKIAMHCTDQNQLNIVAALDSGLLVNCAVSAAGNVAEIHDAQCLLQRLYTRSFANGDWYIVANGDTKQNYKVHIWHGITGQKIHTLDYADQDFNGDYDFLTKNGDWYILTLKYDKAKELWDTINIWDGKKGKIFRSLHGAQTHITAVAIAEGPAGECLVYGGGENGMIYIWNLATGSLVETIKKHQKSISKILLKQGGYEMISTSDDGVINFWSFTPSGIEQVVTEKTKRK